MNNGDVSDDTAVLERIVKIRELNVNNKEYKNKDLYRLLLKPGIYICAYGKIKKNKGAVTPAVNKDTLDGLGLERINKHIISKLKDESYQPKLARLEMIPKREPNKFRPLGIQSPNDKLVQECIRMILESIYEDSFLETSHGFRENHSCLTAIDQIRKNFDGCTFLIEGDIERCFNEIDHNILISILRERIVDERFLNLIRKFLNAGYLVNSPDKKPYISFPDVGTPQGSIISPILCNIYLDKLDTYMNRKINEYCSDGSGLNKNPKLAKLRYEKKKIINSLKNNDQNKTERKQKLKDLKTISLELLKKPYYIKSKIRVYYVRYADDWLIGVNGPKQLAKEIKEDLGNFLWNQLRLTLSENKTKITDIKGGNKVLFLGYHITLQKRGKIKRLLNKNSNKPYYKGTTGHKIKCLIPKERILNSLKDNGYCDHKFFPIAVKRFGNYHDKLIVERFNSVRLGLINFYCLADDSNPFWQIDYILRYSCAKTLAHKHKTSIKKIFHKHGKTLKITTVPKRDLGDLTEKYTVMEKFKTFSPRMPVSKKPKPSRVF
jgi:group II intron reverse transcriptase/maturase